MTIGCLLKVALISAFLLASGSEASLARAPEADGARTIDADYARAETLIRRNDYREALVLLQAALARNPENADTHNLLGFTLRKLKRYDESRDHYLKALAIDPAHLSALEYYGELLLTTGNLGEARMTLRSLERLCPSGCNERHDLEEAFRSYGFAVP